MPRKTLRTKKRLNELHRKMRSLSKKKKYKTLCKKYSNRLCYMFT
jgi:hypothetical protein